MACSADAPATLSVYAHRGRRDAVAVLAVNAGATAVDVDLPPHATRAVLALAADELTSRSFRGDGADLAPADATEPLTVPPRAAVFASLGGMIMGPSR